MVVSWFSVQTSDTNTLAVRQQRLNGEDKWNRNCRVFTEYTGTILSHGKLPTLDPEVILLMAEILHHLGWC